MKATAIILGCALVLSLLLWGYIRAEQGKIEINNQSAEVILLKGGYRSWGFDYSYGQELVPPYKNHWHRPYYFHKVVTHFQTNGFPILWIRR